MAKTPSSITVTPKSQPKELRTSREEKCRRRQTLNIPLQVSVGIVSFWLAVLIVQVETPGYINYHTPKEENSASVVADDVQRIIHEVGHLEFTTETENSHLNNPTSEGTYPVLDEAFSTVANMGAQFSLPTFTKALLEITKRSDGAAAAMALAVDKDHSGNMSKAMIAYRDEIEQIIQIDGHASPGTCQPLSEFAENASFDGSISVFRHIITQIASREGPTQESETESLLKIVAIESLARTLFINKQCSEAESMFSDASEPFRELGYPAYSFNCVLRQAQLLQEVGQHDKALSLLHSLLVYRLEHDQTMFDIMDVALSLNDSYVALSLDETYRNLIRNKDWSEIISRLDDLIRIAKSSVNVYETGSSTIMEAVILIADALSATDEFEKANSLLLVALAKTNQWAIDDDTKYNKANCNYIYAKHLSQRRDHSKAALHLIVALETLMSIGRDGGKLAFSARQRLDWSYAELMGSVGTENSQIIDAITTVKALLIERNGTLSPKASKDVGSGIPGFNTLDEEDSLEHELEVRTTTTKSYKYGVTCSESDITGVGLSEFFVP
jgi:tetratricopeptide (TPR) repeat protein